MIFDNLGIFLRRAATRDMKRAAVERADRWAAVANTNPDLVTDLIIMGRLLSLGVLDENDRLQSTDIELAYEQGRRDFCLDLLAMMKTTPFEINQLLKETRYDVRNTDE